MNEELAKLLVVAILTWVGGVWLGEHWEFTKHRNSCLCEECKTWRKFHK